MYAVITVIITQALKHSRNYLKNIKTVGKHSSSTTSWVNLLLVGKLKFCRRMCCRHNPGFTGTGHNEEPA
jgi:hypothetical protein